MADEYSLSGKVAIITGSGRENGIGAGVAYAFARHGASVVINYVSDSSAARANKVAEKVRGLGGKAAVVQGNITSRPGARHIVQSAMTEFNARSIDILGMYMASG
jgi:NAD(P)-dependent dehydrogenase (short-subunit alcohol dehydrogenase family)